MNEDEVNNCVRECFISDHYISMIINDTVMNLTKIELILYATLINLKDKDNKEGYFEASTSHLVNKINYRMEYSNKTKICSKSIIRSLKTLKDKGLIDVDRDSIIDPITLDYIGKIRYVKINNIDGIKVNRIKIAVFNKVLSSEAIRLYLLLKSFLKDDSMCYISNKLIADKLKINSRKVTIYLVQLQKFLLASVHPVLSDGTRKIEIAR
jgi:hypothetical protein